MSTLGKTGKRVTQDNFHEKFKSYILKNFRHAEEVVCILTDLEDQATAFKERYTPEDLTEDEDKIPSKQKMCEIKLKK